MMLHGLDILIERMKTHPEEFEHEGKYTALLVNIDKHLTEEERQALKQGFHDAARDRFNELVLKSIAGENIEYYEVQSLNLDYDSMMAYPMEHKKMMEEQRKMEREMDLAKQKMAMEMEREQMRKYNNAAQSQGYGMGGLGSQINPWR